MHWLKCLLQEVTTRQAGNSWHRVVCRGSSSCWGPPAARRKRLGIIALRWRVSQCVDDGMTTDVGGLSALVFAEHNGILIA